MPLRCVLPFASKVLCGTCPIFQFAPFTLSHHKFHFLPTAKLSMDGRVRLHSARAPGNAVQSEKRRGNRNDKAPFGTNCTNEAQLVCGSIDHCGGPLVTSSERQTWPWALASWRRRRIERERGIGRSPLLSSRYLDPNAKRRAGDQHATNWRPSSCALRSGKANQVDRASPFTT